MKASLKRQASLLAFANLFTRGLGFCLHLLFARMMGAEALGVMGMAHSVWALALTPVSAGIPTAMSRLTAQRPACDRENVLRAGLSYEYRVSLFIMPLLLLFAPLFAYLLGDMRTLPAIAVATPAMLCFGLCSVYSGYCFGMQNMRTPAIGECVEQTVRFVAAFALLVYFAGKEVKFMAALPGIAEVVGGVVIVMFYRKKLPVRRCMDSPSSALRGQLFRLATPIMLAHLCGAGMQALNAVLLPMCLQRSGLSHAAATAQFGLLNGMAMPLIMLPGIATGALCTVSAPAVTKLEQSGCALKRLMRRMYLAAAGIGVASCMILFFAAGPIGIYLYKQVALVPLLRVLCPVTLVLSIRQVQFGMVSGLGLQAKTLPGTILSAVVTLLCTAWLTPFPSLRLYGAAIACIAGQAVGLVWNTVILHRAIRSVCGRNREIAAVAA